jgi:hypothetical protein
MIWPVNRLANWLDDQPWFHVVRLHKVYREVVQVQPEWRYYTQLCETCDYTWLK